MKSDHSVSPTDVFSFDENGVVILSDLDIFYDNRPATTSGSGSIVPLPFDDSNTKLPPVKSLTNYNFQNF